MELRLILVICIPLLHMPVGSAPSSGVWKTWYFIPENDPIEFMLQMFTITKTILRSALNFNSYLLLINHTFTTRKLISSSCWPRFLYGTFAQWTKTQWFERADLETTFRVIKYCCVQCNIHYISFIVQCQFCFQLRITEEYRCFQIGPQLIRGEKETWGNKHGNQNESDYKALFEKSLTGLKIMKTTGILLHLCLLILRMLFMVCPSLH